jgi:molybdate transport system permease protein
VVRACLGALALIAMAVAPEGARALVRTAPQSADTLGARQTPIEVWSAVSAAPAVREIAERWGAAHGIEVRVRGDATSRIVPQVAAGAPADVIVTADRDWLDRAAELGVVRLADARRIAANRLVLFASAGPAEAKTATAPLLGGEGVAERLAELARGAGTGPLLALAGPEVPLGRRSREVLAAAGTEEVATISLGNARSVIAAVSLGDVPYGLGYATDVLAEPGLRVVARIGAGLHGPVEVWAAPVAVGLRAGAAARPEAEELVAALADDGGRAVFASFGYDPDPEPAPAALVPARPRQPDVPPIGGVVGRSVAVGLLAVLISTLPAVALGRWLARSHSRLRAPIGTVLLLPLVLPPVVTGFVLLALLGSGGPIGALLAAFGLRLSFTFWAAVVAAAVVGFPLYVVVARNAFEAVDPRFEELAATLGSRPAGTLRRVVLPLALPGIAAGAVLALARGLGEFGATIVVAGNIEGETQTIALAVYQLLESPAGREKIWLYVLASAAIAALALATWEWLTARQRARLLDGGRR